MQTVSAYGAVHCLPIAQCVAQLTSAAAGGRLAPIMLRNRSASLLTARPSCLPVLGFAVQCSYSNKNTIKTVHVLYVCSCARSISKSSATQQAAEAKPAEVPETLKVTVNGHPVEVPNGSSLYDAVTKIGAFVPVLCKHPRLPNTPGACRCCFVMRLYTCRCITVSALCK